MQEMYSGSDSNESQKYTQWPLSASAGNAGYAPSAGEQVDWAALAQQWIIMKEAGPPPPVPGEQPVLINNKKDKGQDDAEEGGEAPMEVEADRGDSAWQSAASSANWTWPPAISAQGAWSGAWDNASAWGAQAAATAPPAPHISGSRTPLLPTPDAAGTSRGYNTSAAGAVSNASVDGSSAANSYWTANSAASGTKHIRPHNKRYSKVNVPIKAPTPLPPALLGAPPNESLRHHHRSAISSDVTTPSMPVLDANKRKQLPAWIREGLEKMEKEKMKQLEKEKQKLEREETMEKNKQNDQDTMEILKNTMKERQKSRFDSDEDEEEKKERPRASSPEPVPLTQDELMMKVRRTMTEILLRVTNSLIESVCKEERNRYLKKRKASDQRQTAPRGGVFLSAKLGLGAYGDDSSSNSEEEDGDSDSKGDRDSDSELRDTIKRRQSDFVRTEREIEERLEEAEKQKAESPSRSSTPDSNDNETQVDSTRLQELHRTSAEKNFQKPNNSNGDASDEKRQLSPEPSRSRSRSLSEPSRSSSPSVVSVKSSEAQKKSSRKKSTSYDSDSYERKRKKQRKSKSRSRSRYKSRSRTRSRSKSRGRSKSRSRSRGRDKDYKRYSSGSSKRESRDSRESSSRKKSSRRSKTRSRSRSRHSRSSSRSYYNHRSSRRRRSSSPPSSRSKRSKRTKSRSRTPKSKRRSTRSRSYSRDRYSSSRTSKNSRSSHYKHR